MKRNLRIRVPIWVLLVLLCLAEALAADKSGVKPTVLSLPSGPGAIEGLGESFEPQLNTGTANYAVPLETPPGRAGFGPELALSYNAGHGSGVFGMGWRLDFPCLQRQTDKGLPVYSDYPTGDQIDNDGDGATDEFDEFDTMVYSNGEELVAWPDGSFRFENEQDFTKFVRSGSGWIGTRQDGSVMQFGLTAQGRVQSVGGKVFKWLLEEIHNTNGVSVQFVYVSLDSSAQRYLSQITYNFSSSGDMKILFDYESRPDLISDFKARFEIRTSFRCKAIRMFVGTAPVRTYRLEYHPASELQPVSLLKSVTEVGRDGNSTLPPATFSYTAFEPSLASFAAMPSAPELSLNDADLDLIDINADALPDILDTNSNPHDYFLNKGPDTNGIVRWSERTSMTALNGLQLAANTTQLADMAGEGYADLVDLSGTEAVYYRATKGQQGIGWEDVGRIDQLDFSFSDPNVRMLDVNNDKRTDVMKTETSDYIVWLNLESGVWSEPFSSPSVNSDALFNREYIRLADMNGDRLQDLVWIDDGACSYYPSIGMGEFAPPVEMDNPPVVDVFSSSRLFVFDVNGDGLSDAVYVGDTKVTVWINRGLDPTDPTNGRFADPFNVSTPTGFNTTFRQADMNGNGSVDLLCNAQPGGGETFTFLDFAPGEQPYQLRQITNGIGLTTTIHYRSSIQEMVRDQDASPAVMWTAPPPISVPVISKVELNDGLQTYTTTYQYHDAYYDAKEREFRGFAAAEKLEIGDSFCPTLVTLYEFHTGNGESEALKGKPKQVETREGTVAGPIYYRDTNSWVTQQLHQGPTGDTRAVNFAFNSTSVRTLIEKGNGAPVDTQSTSQFTFDPDVTPGNKQFGVIERITTTDFGRMDSPTWDDERRIETSYSAAFASGKQAWILDKVVEVKTSDENGAFVARKQNFYDGSTGLGSVNIGNLTKVVDFKDSNSSINSVRNVYDQWGNIVAIHDPLSNFSNTHFREIVYDSAYHTFPIQEKVHTGAELLVGSATYDVGFGVVMTSTEFNGFTTSYGYDTFGRLVEILKPGDVIPTTTYDYQLAQPISGGRLINWVETRQNDGTPTLDSRTFYDGLGRVVMTRAEGEEPGQIVVSDTVQFNKRRVAALQYLPYFDGGTLAYEDPDFQASAHTTHFSDALGRETKMVQPDLSFAETIYAPLTKLSRDEEQTRNGSSHQGCGMRYVNDGLGRLRQVFEIVKIADNGDPLASPVEWPTNYRYDLLDNFTGYTDSKNNQKHFTYDGLKRNTFMNDPDRGVMTYEYDDASNVIRTVDAKNQTIRYTYDGANRLTKEFYSASGSIADVEYHYDVPFGPVPARYFPGVRDADLVANAVLKGNPPNLQFDRNADNKVDSADVVKSLKTPAGPVPTATARNTRGYLSWVRDQSGEEHTSYDQRGRQEWVVKRIANTGPNDLYSFQTQYAYDALDRTTRLTYPDDSFVDYSYNSRGLLESVPNVIAKYDYNELGQTKRIDLACGVTTNQSYDIRQRLTGIHSVRSSNSLALQDLNYTYDAVSNITAITDGRSGQTLDAIGTELGIASAEARKFDATQSFQYDSLYRLTNATNPSVYGTIIHRYDRIGNMVRQDANLLTPEPAMNLGVMSIGGAAGSSNRNGRAANDPPGPHALTGTANGPNGTQQFAYDANGNMTQDGTMTLAWDIKDRVVSTSTNNVVLGAYTYDYNNMRRKKTVSASAQGATAGDVFYVNADCEVRNEKLLKYIQALAARVARADSTATSASAITPAAYYLNNNIGSVGLTLDAVGKVSEQIAQYPFGYVRKEAKRPRGPKADYTFTGKEQDDESKLHYFESRYLASSVGRFIRVDTLASAIKAEWTYVPQKMNLYAYSDNKPIACIDDGNKGLATVLGFVLVCWNLPNANNNAEGPSVKPGDSDYVTDWNKIVDRANEGNQDLFYDGAFQLVGGPLLEKGLEKTGVTGLLKKGGEKIIGPVVKGVGNLIASSTSKTPQGKFAAKVVKDAIKPATKALTDLAVGQAQDYGQGELEDHLKEKLRAEKQPASYDAPSGYGFDKPLTPQVSPPLAGQGSAAGADERLSFDSSGNVNSLPLTSSNSN